MQVQILDKGYVRLIEGWGDDRVIIESARVSTQKGFLGWGTDAAPGDEKLLRYLYKNGHTSPFEMCGATFEVKAPLFVVHQWQRHRTQSYNEASARYAPLPNDNYLPTVDRMLMRDSANKQAGSTGETLTREDAEFLQERMRDHYDECQYQYQRMLDRGMPKELARCVLPTARYTVMRASANLHNWMHFLKLRQDPHAQWEIRQYANAVNATLSNLFPRTMELFNEQ